MSKRRQCKIRFLEALHRELSRSKPRPRSQSQFQFQQSNLLFQTKPFKSQFYNPRFHTFPSIQTQILSQTLTQTLSKSNPEIPKSDDFHQQIFENLITNLRRKSRDERIAKLLGNYSNNQLLDDMLYLFGRKQYIDHFWLLIEVMKSKGLGITKRVYFNAAENFSKENMAEDLVKLRKMYIKQTEIEDLCSKICMIIRENEWGEGLRKELMVFRKDLCDVELVTMVIDDLGLERTKTFKEFEFDVDSVWDVKFHNELKSYWDRNVVKLVFEPTGVYSKKALLFFWWVEERTKLKHGKVSYNAILRVLSLGDCVDEFWRVAGEMKNAGYEMDVKTYDFATKAFYKRGMFKHAVDLYEWRVGLSTNPSALKDHLLQSTEEKFEDAKAHLVNADLPFDSLLTHFCLKDKADNAYKLLIGMIDGLGLRPLEGTYRMLIRALLRLGKLDEIMDLYWLMRTTQGYAPCMTVVFEKFLEAGMRREAQMLLSYCPRYFSRNQKVRILFCTEEPASFWEKYPHYIENDQMLLYKRREALRASMGAYLNH